MSSFIISESAYCADKANSLTSGKEKKPIYTVCKSLITPLDLFNKWKHFYNFNISNFVCNYDIAGKKNGTPCFAPQTIRENLLICICGVLSTYIVKKIKILWTRVVKKGRLVLIVSSHEHTITVHIETHDASLICYNTISIN